jgi:putative tryptophan/tyrosine transport system substrate-binding protein
MRRREFVGLVGGAAISPALAKAQQAGRIPVVGILWGAKDAEAEAPNRLPFLKGLAALGYVPGKTIILEERYPNEIAERFGSLADELVDLKPDVLVARGGTPIFAVHRATSTIPTVFVAVSDPVATGLAASISKPGGNITGLTQMSGETSAKRLLFIQQSIPALSHVALLREPTNPGGRLEMSQLSSAAKALGLSVEVFDVSTGTDIDQAFQRMEEQRLPAVIVFSANLLISERKRISALGLKHRIAIMGPTQYFVDAGAMLSYGPDFATLWYGAASFVDKILKGERVGDIPIQQPIKFDLSINLQTAKALGIELPPEILALADKVIE